jgi:hypothetical protein
MLPFLSVEKMGGKERGVGSSFQIIIIITSFFSTSSWWGGGSKCWALAAKGEGEGGVEEVEEKRGHAMPLFSIQIQSLLSLSLFLSN